MPQAVRTQGGTGSLNEEGEEAPLKGKERSMTRKEGLREKGTKSGRFFGEAVKIPMGHSKSSIKHFRNPSTRRARLQR